MPHNHLDPKALRSFKALEEAIPSVQSLSDLKVFNGAMTDALRCAQERFEDARARGDMAEAQGVFDELQGATEALRRSRSVLSLGSVFIAEFKVQSVVSGMNVQTSFTIPKGMSPLDMINRAHEVIVATNKVASQEAKPHNTGLVDSHLLKAIEMTDERLTSPAVTDLRLSVSNARHGSLNEWRLPSGSQVALVWAVSFAASEQPLFKDIVTDQGPLQFDITLRRKNPLHTGTFTRLYVSGVEEAARR